MTRNDKKLERDRLIKSKDILDVELNVEYPVTIYSLLALINGYVEVVKLDAGSLQQFRSIFSRYWPSLKACVCFP
jgi:hypothetical protein